MNKDQLSNSSKDMTLTERTEGPSSHVKHIHNIQRRIKRIGRLFKTIIDLTAKYIILCTVLLITAVVGFLIFFRPTATVSVPNLVGKSFVDATILLQERQLYVQVQEQFTTDPSDIGKVLQQSPLAGMPIRGGREVSVIVSKGTVVSEVPDLIGFTIDRARDTLKSQFAGFQNLLSIHRIIKQFSEDSHGIVISQDPEAGYRINNAGTALDLIISRGPENSEKIPDLTGFFYDVVLDIIHTKKASFEFYFSESTAPTDEEIETYFLTAGVVIEQAPVAGSILTEKSIIRIGIRAQNLEQKLMLNPNKPPKDFRNIKIFKIPINIDRTKAISVYKIENENKQLIIENIFNQDIITLPYEDIDGVEYEAVSNGNIFWKYRITHNNSK